MNRSALTIVGFVTGALAAGVAIVRGAEARLHQSELVNVVYVQRDLPAGTRLTTAMVGMYSIPRRFVPGSAVRPSEAHAFVNRRLAVPLRAEDMLLATALVRDDESDQFEACLAALEQEQRSSP
jgi:Flp pilus assembly protein CpaB